MSDPNTITESRPVRSILIAFVLVAGLALFPMVALLPVAPAAAQVQKEPRVGYNAALVSPDRIMEIE